MRRIFKMLILSLAISLICLNCREECDDCLELTTKNIKYISSAGTNLLFGTQAIYNPDSVIIKVGDDTIINSWKQQETGTIMFNLEENYTTYYMVLSDSVIDTLDFEVAQRKSKACCGYVIFSTKTLLNGKEIENNDLVIITH